VGTTWTQFLRESPSCGHAVQVYRDVSELAESVGEFLAAGLEAGEPGVVIVRPEHRRALAATLGSRGCDRRDPLLTIVDAEATLALFMDGSTPSPARFEDAVGGLLDRVAERHPGRRIRAFGEMVDVLCERGDAAAAVTLERLWNDLARTRDFSLLCGYRLDVFDRAAQVGLLPDVCRLHSHVLPASDPDRLARAVDAALEDVLGAREAGHVYVVVATHAREGRVPMAQLALMWVSAQMPVLAERVLARAREHYDSHAAASPAR